ncbi:MAG: hypothetical protein DSO07_09475 [Thermoproteota archaeon]|uniref:Ornithine cyclodeaminase family protein n=1 Tax=Candidatus Methanodesulfokora washburnensis TaxID=2478471 RepID=A0A520KMR5_9CREN|nr:MAG: hypothetical protein EF810_02445 [Candidatus Methanodesulfokores washburnensis]TDA40334.1 MAG: hypothetical protein DSO07_09475 [Candidatus Korarchaeota archaeon]
MIMLRINFTSQELPVCFLTDRDVEQAMGNKIEFLKELISITREILSDLRPYAFDKISLYARTSDPAYPTKIRAMVGCYGRYSVVRSFSANERNREMGRRRSNNFCIIYDNETTDIVAIAEGNLISDYRTASITVVGLDAVMKGDYTVAVLGATGSVGNAVLQSLSALDKKPRKVIISARGRGGFSNVKERLEDYIKRIKVDLEIEPSESIEKCIKGVDAVIDLISMPKPVSLVKEGMLPEKVTYIDVGKNALDHEFAMKFDTYVFDSVELRKLPSPATFALSIRTMLAERNFRVMEIGDILTGRERPGDMTLITVLGVPVVDAAFCQMIMRRLSLI